MNDFLFPTIKHIIILSKFEYFLQKNNYLKLITTNVKIIFEIYRIFLKISNLFILIYFFISYILYITVNNVKQKLTLFVGY